MIAVGVLTFVSCMIITAPYGRYSTDKGWGAVIHARFAWIFMESPNLWVPLVTYQLVPDLDITMSLPNKILLCCFLLHYFNRSIIYPLRMDPSCAPMPSNVMWLAFTYCCWNSFTQSVSLLYINQLPESWLFDPRFLVGTAIFIAGMALNIQADEILQNIRKGKREKQYEIPRGGLFELISCANYGAEIIEWSGFAIACWSLPAAAFAWYTFSNIGPRGYKHHLWYQEKFREEYPKNRKAVIPFVW